MAARARKASPAAKATAARKAPAKRAARRTAPAAEAPAKSVEERLAAVEVGLQNIAKFLAMGVAQNALQQQMSAQMQAIAPQQ